MSICTVSPVIALTSRVPERELAARVALAVAGVAGDPGVAVAIAACGGAARLVAAVHDREDHAAPLSPLVRERIRTIATGREVARTLETTARLGLHLLTPDSDQWPAQVHALRGIAPLVLWVRGEAVTLTSPSVAVTGTASPTPYGTHMGIELATGLAGRGWALVAGTGGGIDQVVLRSAAAMKVRAIAVAPVSLDHLRPAEPGIVQVSELPPGSGMTVRSQRRAKHLIAAIAAKTIVVEAELSSGALRTADAAHAIGRPVGVVPGRMDSQLSAGCHLLAQKHGVELITSVREADQLR
jgi:DNA processing protein